MEPAQPPSHRYLFCVPSVYSVVPMSSLLRGFLRAFVSFVVSAIALSLNAQTRFDPPAATYDSPVTLRSLKSALDANPAEAATSIEAILKNHFDDLTRIDPQTILSVPAAIDSLEPHKREKVLAEYRRLYDADAQNAYDDARERDAGSIEALCTVAKRYALSSIAARAYAEAAQRAARAGDATTALTLDRLATSAGFKGDEAHAALMKAMTS